MPQGLPYGAPSQPGAGMGMGQPQLGMPGAGGAGGPGMEGLDPAILEMLMGLIQQLVPPPAGGPSPLTLPSAAVPSSAQQPTEEEQVMDMLMSVLQSGNTQSLTNASQGQAGGIFGGLGGRPPGT